MAFPVHREQQCSWMAAVNMGSEGAVHLTGSALSLCLEHVWRVGVERQRKGAGMRGATFSSLLLLLLSSPQTRLQIFLPASF